MLRYLPLVLVVVVACGSAPDPFVGQPEADGGAASGGAQAASGGAAGTGGAVVALSGGSGGAPAGTGGASLITAASWSPCDIPPFTPAIVLNCTKVCATFGRACSATGCGSVTGQAFDDVGPAGKCQVDPAWIDWAVVTQRVQGCGPVTLPENTYGYVTRCCCSG